MRDIKFLSGEFFETEIPHEKRYLLKYFDDELQEAFLRFYFTFGDRYGFTDFTGRFCTDRYLRKLEARLLYLTSKHQEAKQSFNLSLVWEIESGGFKIKNIGK